MRIPAQMIGRRCAVIVLGGFLILLLSVNIYFIQLIAEGSSGKSPKNVPLSEGKLQNEPSQLVQSSENSRLHGPAKPDIVEKIKEKILTLPSKYFKQNSTYQMIVDRLLGELKIMPNADKSIWKIPNNNWIDGHQIIPPVAPELGTLLNVLRRAKILQADSAPVGTQLKLMVSLEYGGKALFKPQWYSRDAVIEGPVYHGKDRHNAEVVAFHLSSLLGLRRVPLTVTRKINLTSEVRPRASQRLLNTMYQDGNHTCLYGVCHYCSPDDPVCGEGDVLEGSLILWLPKYLRLVKHRHPWQRTYKKNKLALWETDDNYCQKVKASKEYSIKSSSRLLDLVDATIFDFLIDNGDRHHYELAQNNFHNPAILLIDNGKSFANPNVDHLDILAPLYQCCIIHKTTWDRLQLFSGGALSVALEKLLAQEASAGNVLPLLTEDHLHALDRRLLSVYAAVEYCLETVKYSSNVILDHR